jgi:hypothetical protein
LTGDVLGTDLNRYEFEVRPAAQKRRLGVLSLGFVEELIRALVTNIGPRLFSLTKATEPLAGHQRLCLPSRMLMD